MTDPDRLLSRLDADDLRHDLLRSARDDAPTDAARRRTALALGIAAGVTAGTTATTAAAASSSKLGLLGGLAGLAKWIGVGVVGSAIVVGAVKYVAAPQVALRATDTLTQSKDVRSQRPVGPSFPPSNGALAPVADLAPAPALDEPPVAPVGSVAPVAPVAPVALARATAPAPSVVAAPRVAPAPSALIDEVQALDRARAGLSRGDARGALDALDAYDRAYKGGALGPEATVLRIEALAESGADDEAATRARSFLAAYPDSPQERRVRSVLDTIVSKQKKE